MFFSFPGISKFCSVLLYAYRKLHYLLVTGIMFFEDSACSIPDVLISDNISSSVKRQQSKNDIEKVI